MRNHSDAQRHIRRDRELMTKISCIDFPNSDGFSLSYLPNDDESHNRNAKVVRKLDLRIPARLSYIVLDIICLSCGCVASLKAHCRYVRSLDLVQCEPDSFRISTIPLNTNSGI